jgi:parallel beta-helix repeat protein
MRTRSLAVTVVVAVGLLALSLWLLGGSSRSMSLAAPVTHTVCPAGPPACDYSSPQAAVDGAAQGDVILVAEGTYRGVSARAVPFNYDFPPPGGVVTQVLYVNKAVTIQGGYVVGQWTRADPAAHPAILDAQGMGRVLFIGEWVDPTIEGLGITGGDAAGQRGDREWDGIDAGGGVYVLGGAPALRGNVVYGNQAGRGGGLYVASDHATIERNTILSNTASEKGGGAYLYDSTATVQDNTISDNVATSEGGGLHAYGGQPTLLRNRVTDNQAPGYYGQGGGIYLFGPQATLRGNVVLSNSVSFRGGGIFISGDSQLDGDIVRYNQAPNGAGFYLYTGSPLFTNVVVADNQAEEHGSGLYVWSAFPQLLHTTFARNIGGDGTAVYVDSYHTDYCTAILTNTIIVSHTVGVWATEGNAATLDHTLFYSLPGGQVGGPGMVTLHTGIVGAPRFAMDGYHITPDSAAIDAGLDAGVQRDVDGERRPCGAGADLGADEYCVYHLYLPVMLKRH